MNFALRKMPKIDFWKDNIVYDEFWIFVIFKFSYEIND